MPRMSSDVLRDLLQQPHVGVLATLRRDGRPYTVPVWWLHDAPPGGPDVPASHRDPMPGAFWLTGTTSRIWCRQLMRDPRASLCIEAAGPARHVEIDGDCVPHLAEDFDIWPISRRLAEKYVGLGDPARAAAVDAFMANMRTEPRLLFRLDPLTWRAIDLTVYRGKRADREHQARQAEGGRGT